MLSYEFTFCVALVLKILASLFFNPRRGLVVRHLTTKGAPGPLTPRHNSAPHNIL